MQVSVLSVSRSLFLFYLFISPIGACGGGHYYAYILDLEINQWYHFNDSTVTAVDINTVREAW